MVRGVLTRAMVRAFRITGSLGVCVGLMSGVAQNGSASQHRARPTPHPLNVVLITLDTTRADRLGSWGWPHARTPNLDALAARGVRFAQCDCSAPITLPSHATILTGMYPPRHGVRDNATFVLKSEVETLAERLRSSGYDTAAVVSSIVLAHRFGLGQGFDSYNDDFNEGPTSGTAVEERSAENATTAAIQVLHRMTPPFFLWVHYFDPHAAYRPPPPFDTGFGGPNRSYDGEIASMDSQIGRLVARLPQATVVAVVGDHGEMLGEHCEQTHGIQLFAGSRRVPLLIAAPCLPAGRTVTQLVRTADLAPTILQLAGARPLERIDGLSLIPLIDGMSAPPRISYCESFLPFFAYRWYPLRAISDGRWLYLDAPQPSLYDLETDSDESDDLAFEMPAKASTMKDLLTALLATMGDSPDQSVTTEISVSNEERRQLAALGYVGATGGGLVRCDLPDPRSRILVAGALHDIAVRIQQNGCHEVLAALNAVLGDDPENPAALNYASYCMLEAERWLDALEMAERAARAAPGTATPVLHRAEALQGLGEHREAERAYRRALEIEPSSRLAVRRLSMLLRSQGRSAEAVEVLDRAICETVHDPGTYLERGMAWAEIGQTDRALADFCEAARRDPGNPLPVENAARAALALRRFDQAAQYFEKLLRLQPERGDVWAVLGGLYQNRLSRPDDAMRCYGLALGLTGDPAARRRLRAAMTSVSSRP